MSNSSRTGRSSAGSITISPIRRRRPLAGSGCTRRRAVARRHLASHPGDVRASPTRCTFGGVGGREGAVYDPFVTDADAQAIVVGLDETWSATASACEDLHPDAWELSTDCPGWSVRDHLSHLIGTELSLLGEKAPPAPDPMPVYVKNPIGEGNEAWINARRATPGTEILEEFVEVTARRLAELRSFDDARWDVVGWSPIGQAPYRDYMRIRIFDSWVHGQDVRMAVGRPGDRFGQGESVSLDRVALGMPFVVGRKVAPPDGASVVFDVTGPLARTLVIVMDGGRAGVADT